MYSRGVTDKPKILIPENYDGTAFMEKQKEPTADGAERSIKVLGEPSADTKMSPVMALPEERDEPSSKGEERASPVGASALGFFDKLGIGGLFGKGSGQGLGIRLPKIGGEEILIIAMALFLFFSKDGDKECAIMLGLLLLIAN